MNKLEPCMEILPDSQTKLWPKLANSKNLKMTLYGGTALALRLGHRKSIDFDFFTSSDITSSDLSREFPFLNDSGVRVLQSENNTYTYLVPSEPGVTDPRKMVKLSFFGGINFGRVGEPSLTSDGVMQVASLEDLMSTKLKVILQRVELKDYVDVAALIQSGASLKRGLSSAGLMFGSAFSPADALKTLTYFKGGDLEDLDEGVKKYLVKEVSAVDLNLPVIEKKSGKLFQEHSSPSLATIIESGQTPPIEKSNKILQESINKSMRKHDDELKNSGPS